MKDISEAKISSKWVADGGICSKATAARDS